MQNSLQIFVRQHQLQVFVLCQNLKPVRQKLGIVLEVSKALRSSNVECDVLLRSVASLIGQSHKN